MYVTKIAISSGALKLMDGDTIGEGSLLVYDDLHVAWGAICGDGWTAAAASIACSQMGFSSGAAGE